ncbi:hypothetical protein PF001_g25448, partial [Phytophthora fragariae]
MSTVLVYTAFNAIIVSVPLRWQPLAALIAPIFKITQKNVLRRILHGKDDVVPEMTIFNIDISNAFFISSNIQREASVNTGILLILIDLLQMLISLCDLRLMLQSVKGIADKMEISTEEAVAVALTIATKYPELRDRRMRTESLYHSKAEIHFLPSHRRTSNKKTTTSGQRFTNKRYRDSTSVQRSLVLLGSIPLLSLACAAVVDAFPLESPDLGLAHSGTLWARGVLVTLFDSHALSWMFDQYVPQLEISRRTLIVTAIAAAVVVQASALILILLLWYPLPFTLIWVSGPWIWTLALALKLSKGEFLRKNPQVLNEVRRFSTLLILTTSTGLVYVAFNVIFQTVPAEWQTPAAVLVPVFKVIQKNVICRLLRGQDDVKPEIVNFNVDVTNALFISSIMQNLQSVKSSAMLVVVDFVQMLTSLFDLRLMLKDIRDITNESTDQAIACALVIVGKYPELGELPLLT